MNKSLYTTLLLSLIFILVGCTGYDIGVRDKDNPIDNQYDEYNCTNQELEDASMDRCNSIKYEKYLQSQRVE